MSEEHATGVTNQDRDDGTDAGASPVGPSVEDTPPGESPSGGRKARTPRPFPGMSFKEALTLAEAIQKYSSGQRVRRLTLFESLNRSPTSGATRALVTASNQYGLTTGGYNAEYLDLTPEGRIASSSTGNERDRLSTQIDLAIVRIAAFNTVYEKFADAKVPAPEVLRDEFAAADIPEDRTQEALETFLANARELGLIRNIAGSEHLVRANSVLDALASDTPAPIADSGPVHVQGRAAPAITSQSGSAAGAAEEGDPYADICFIISPIGANDSEFRKHADMILATLVEPALKELGLRAIRADQISKPGLITSQVVEHIARSALVIADLSFANPNVYYELGLRHAVQKPVVQITRVSDPLPFDVGQFRTVTIDTSDIYALVPAIDLHRQEITRQCRAALSEGSPAQTQLSLFFPKFWDYIER